MKARARDHGPDTLQTVARAMLLLSAFDDVQSEWGITQISSRFGWSTTVTHRLMATLASAGFLVVDEASHRYRLGPALLRLASLSLRAGPWPTLKPTLARLSEDTGETSVLALIDGFSTRVTLVAETGEDTLRYRPQVGDVYPAHSGATSKACFAFLPRQLRLQVLSERPLHRFTDRTVTDLLQLEREFLVIRTQRYAATVGEYQADIAAIAVPIFSESKVIGSVTIAGSGDRITTRSQALVERVQEAAAQIERQLAAVGFTV